MRDASRNVGKSSKDKARVFSQLGRLRQFNPSSDASYGVFRGTKLYDSALKNDPNQADESCRGDFGQFESSFQTKGIPVVSFL